MHKVIITAVTAAVAALSALSIIGDGQPVPHHAPPGTVHLTAASIPNIAVESKDAAGYQEGFYTRQMTATFRLPSDNACATAFRTRSPAGDGIAVTLGSIEQATTGTPLSSGPASALGVSFVPSLAGCGLISPAFNSNTSGTTVLEPLGSITLNPTDSVTLDLGYSQGGQVTWATVTDNTTSQSVHSTFAGKETYVGGSVAAGFGPLTATGTQVKLWAVKGARMATYHGHVGALGAFRPQPVTATSNGTSEGVQEAFPKALWNLGQNFSIIGD